VACCNKTTFEVPKGGLEDNWKNFFVVGTMVVGWCYYMQRKCKFGSGVLFVSMDDNGIAYFDVESMLARGFQMPLTSYCVNRMFNDIYDKILSMLPISKDLE
jgi:hypothetical protein